VEVHRFTLHSSADLLDELHGIPPQLRLHVECGSGTYVRALVRDLGNALGCGAHVAELRRLWVDPFRDPRMWTLDELCALSGRGERALDACLLPMEAGMLSWPRLEVSAATARRLGHGQQVTGTFVQPGEVAIFTENGRALGLGEITEERILRPKRMFTWAKDI